VAGGRRWGDGCRSERSSSVRGSRGEEGWLRGAGGELYYTMERCTFLPLERCFLGKLSQRLKETTKKPKFTVY